MGGGGQYHVPAALTSGKRPIVLIVQGQAGPQGWSGLVRQMSAQSCFEHQTFQVALSYTGHRKKKQCVCEIPYNCFVPSEGVVSSEHMEGETRHV